MSKNIVSFLQDNPETNQSINDIIHLKSSHYFYSNHNKTITSTEVLHLLNDNVSNSIVKNILLNKFPNFTFSNNIIDTLIILIHISLNDIGSIVIDIQNNNYAHTTADSLGSNISNHVTILSYLEDIHFFYPGIKVSVYLYDKIDEETQNSFKYINELYCRKASTYSEYVSIKSKKQNEELKFPKLFYIKFPGNLAHNSNDTKKLILSKYSKGITFGTFDLFHFGHDNILKRCRNYCDYLCLGLSSDELNIKKGKTSIYDYNKRKNMIETSYECYVDMIFKEEFLEYKDRYIKENNCDILMMGDDWLEKFDWVSCTVLYMERTPNISTTMLKEQMNY